MRLALLRSPTPQLANEGVLILMIYMDTDVKVCDLISAGGGGGFFKTKKFRVCGLRLSPESGGQARVYIFQHQKCERNLKGWGRREGYLWGRGGGGPGG